MSSHRRPHKACADGCRSVADGFTKCFPHREAFRFDHPWQHLFHYFIIPPCEHIGGLAAHEAHRSSESGCYMTAEEVDVEHHLRVRCVGKAFQEICGECRRAHGVVASLTHRHIIYMCDTAPYHRQTLVVAEKRSLLLHGNDIEPCHILRRLFHEIAVTQGERVGIHHYNACLFADGFAAVFAAHRFKIAAVGVYSAHSRLHEYRFGSFCKQTERHALEHHPVGWFGEEPHHLMSGGIGNAHQVRHHAA